MCTWWVVHRGTRECPSRQTRRRTRCGKGKLRLTTGARKVLAEMQQPPLQLLQAVRRTRRRLTRWRRRRRALRKLQGRKAGGGTGKDVQELERISRRHEPRGRRRARFEKSPRARTRCGIGEWSWAAGRSFPGAAVNMWR